MFVASLAFSVAFTHKEYGDKVKTDAEIELNLSPSKSTSDERLMNNDNMKIEQSTFFFTAFLQSSLPNEIIEDLRFVVRFEYNVEV